jgi:uncharacterized repeat protein (TIGR01451 family)
MSLAAARSYHTATLLRSGKVLVVGGWNGSALIASAELYDPATDSWSSAGTLASARQQHTATLLASGKVLIAGGRGNGYNKGELYDPDTNTWSAGGTLVAGRYLHAASLLATGEVLLTGGEQGDLPQNTTDLYDPASNTWSSAGTLPERRYVHTSTLLPSGKVLIAGGGSVSGPLSTVLASAELYARDSGFDAVRRPAIITASGPISPGDSIELTGRHFDGDSEGGSGNTSGSASDTPLLQLRRIDNDEIHWTIPALDSARSDSSYHSEPLVGLPAGHYATTLFVNGIPSLSRVIEAQPRFTVTPSADGGGRIDPATPQFVAEGTSTSFDLVPDVGHHLDGVSGSCGGTLAGSTFTTASIFEDCSVVVDFAIDVFTLTYSAGPDGTIEGASSQSVEYGASGIPVTAIPDAGHHFFQWSDGGASNPRTDSNVTANLDVTAQFDVDTFTINATAGANGSIEPAAQSVDFEDAAHFTVSPNEGYFATVTGDTCTVTQTGDTSWVSNGITSECHVTATFSTVQVAVLAMEVTDHRDYAQYADTLEYVVTVSNTGNAGANGITLANVLPSSLDATATSWTCEGAGDGATCTPGGTGALDTDGITLPAGRSLVWRVVAPVLGGTTAESIDFSVVASLTGASSVTESDSDPLVVFRGDFEVRSGH